MDAVLTRRRARTRSMRRSPRRFWTPVSYSPARSPTARSTPGTLARSEPAPRPGNRQLVWAGPRPRRVRAGRAAGLGRGVRRDHSPGRHDPPLDCSVALVLVAVAGLPLQLAFAASHPMRPAASLDVQRGIWGRVLRSPVTLVNGGRRRSRNAAGRAGGGAGPDREGRAAACYPPSLGSSPLARAVRLRRPAWRRSCSPSASRLLLVAVWLVASRGSGAGAGGRGHRSNERVRASRCCSAIPKLRVAGAEARAFLAWAERFRDGGRAGASCRGCPASPAHRDHSHARARWPCSPVGDDRPGQYPVGGCWPSRPPTACS